MIAALASPGRAGTIAGKLELPRAPDPGPVVARGFIERVENPLAEIRKRNIAPYFVVALDGEPRPEAAPAAVTWDLVGESFARPVIAVPVGAEVVIRNLSKVARTVGASEDAKLITGPLGPNGTRSFRAAQPAIYTIGDKDAPHLRGKIVVVATPYVAGVDDQGRFELTDIPDGSYQLRIFYYDPVSEAGGRASGWLALTTDVTVATKGKANRIEIHVKVPALERAPAAAPGKQ